MDEEIKLLHDLLLKLGVTLTLAAVLFGVYYFMSRKRAKKWLGTSTSPTFSSKDSGSRAYKVTWLRSTLPTQCWGEC